MHEDFQRHLATMKAIRGRSLNLLHRGVVLLGYSLLLFAMANLLWFHSEAHELRRESFAEAFKGARRGGKHLRDGSRGLLAWACDLFWTGKTILKAKLKGLI